MPGPCPANGSGKPNISATSMHGQAEKEIIWPGAVHSQRRPLGSRLGIKRKRCDACMYKVAGIMEEQSRGHHKACHRAATLIPSEVKWDEMMSLIDPWMLLLGTISITLDTCCGNPVPTYWRLYRFSENQPGRSLLRVPRRSHLMPRSKLHILPAHHIAGFFSSRARPCCVGTRI